ncbi:MAG: hypothetical protein EXR69_00635 [Myxococcales bacterium]|nr:hypothetical protein [Myxococcales bacterium]
MLSALFPLAAPPAAPLTFPLASQLAFRVAFQVSFLGALFVAPALANPPAATESTATPSGLRVSARVHAEALVGFPVVVDFTIQNESATTQMFPDLAARPHLARFSINGPKGKSERYNTPPAFDVASTWSLAPHSERNVLLEIPSSAGFAAGDYTITVSVQDPGGALTFAPVKLTLATPKPIAGTPVWEPTIAQNLGTIFPWVQDRQGATGSAAALYLMQFDARAQTRAFAQYWLADLASPVDPVLTRSRAGESFSRYVYWLVPGTTTATMAFGRLDGTSFRSVQTASLPYPTADLFDRGITDARGQLVLPLWVPSPAGKGGSLKIWTVNERGVQSLRNMVDLPSRPTLHATAIDAASNLLVAIGVAGGVDVYRADITQPPEIPARGTRHWAAIPGWSPAAITFDVLPDAASRPGGLSLFTLLRSNSTAEWKSQWSDLAGGAFSPGGGPWSLPGELVSMVTSGYGTFYTVSRDPTGAYWYQPQGTTPASVAAAIPLKSLNNPTLFLSGDMVRARVLGGQSVVTDVTLGPTIK